MASGKSKAIPSDKINLRLILVSGKTHEALFSTTDSASHITQHIYDSWPEDWVDEERPECNILRLIYQGRFLHGNVTLGALQLTPGKTTVMHLVARENLPEPNNRDQLKKDKGRETGCANCCTIV
ncbi:ubiquitin-like protein 3 [Watersipora subatra]|uniref:ubiquitin-like protein 3 n=1 Tax=Watersipora subatra TaxID=2589382 RepID=UPI00355BB274